MANGIVAASTLQPFGFAMYNVAVDFRRDVFVTAPAGVFRHSVIELGDLDRVWIVAAGKVVRMPESVVGLHCILADDVVRCVAIVTCGHRTMARLEPSIVLGLHDVAIGACCGPVGQVGISFGIDKGVGA